MFPSRLAQPSQHVTGLALKSDLPHVFAEWLHQQAVPQDLSLLSHSSAAGTEPNTMGNKTPHALVPPAQIRLVLTLKGMHSGWALSQSISYGVFSKSQKNIKSCTTNDVHMRAPAFNCPHSAVHCVIGHTIHPKPTSCLPGYPSSQCKCFTPHSYPTATDLKALLLTHNKTLSISAPHFWGLSCSSISPTVSGTADQAGLLPSPSCTAGIREQSQPWQRYHHTTTHPHSRPKAGAGRGRSEGLRKEQEDATRTRLVPHEHGWGSLGATWHKQNRDDILQVTQGTHPTQREVDTEGELLCTFSADAAREQQGNQRMITSKC